MHGALRASEGSDTASSGWFGCVRIACVLLSASGLAGCDSPEGSASRSASPTPGTSGEPPAIQVAAASDLTRAFEELGAEFERATGRKVVFTFGSTGLLATQIEHGAPFDMLAAANVSFVDELVRTGDCDGATRAPYARGRLVVWSKRGLVAPPSTLSELRDARFRRIAIAHPEHAPYGKAAKEALEKLGLWRELEPRIVYGENVKQTLQFAESGNVEAALVAWSLVVGSDAGHTLSVDDTLHAPIDQALVVCKHGHDQAGARAFADLVNGPEGRAVLRRYGFLLPGETLVQVR